MRISDWSSDVCSSDLKKTAPFDASVFHDRYIDALKDLVQRKLKAKGGKVTPEEEPARPSGSNVVDLMAALKKSLEKPEGKAPATQTTARNAPDKKATAKKPAAEKPATRRSEARRVGTESVSTGKTAW